MLSVLENIAKKFAPLDIIIWYVTKKFKIMIKMTKITYILKSQIRT